MAQVVEHSPGKCKALNSNLSTMTSFVPSYPYMNVPLLTSHSPQCVTLSIQVRVTRPKNSVSICPSSQLFIQNIFIEQVIFIYHA
jgi:hypothetical protein